ncbi:PAS domain S-box protein [Lunatimonas salinarum]|uniref:PAS domain S-box protein n=1 Tax=Lunatimonas salinarum TaxID=1774590 RepID=UPI001ADEED9C|nr:PAS domain S-box protein [Lunatimonas salinarum]
MKYKSVYWIAGMIISVLCWGVAFYGWNYSNQVAQKQNVEFAEQKINELNEIYINFLTAVMESRGYRLNQSENRQENYLSYRNATQSLLRRYSESAEFAQDSALFLPFSNLIHRRLNDLDAEMGGLRVDSLTSQTHGEIEAIDSALTLLQERQQAILAYWDNLSVTASEDYDHDKDLNDQLFVIWFLSTVVLAVFFIFALRKNVRSQLRHAIAEERLAITQQKEAEFSAAFDYASIGMALVDIDGRWLRVNRSLCALLGYSGEELTGFTFQDLTHPDDLAENLVFYEKMLKEEIETYQMEKRYITKAGEYVWVLLSVSLVWEDRKPKYFIGQMQNITKQKELQNQLLFEKSRLQQVIDGTDAGTWQWNIQTGETIFNEKWAEMIGYSLSDLAPISIETWGKFVHPEDLAQSNQVLQDYFDKKSEYYECACRMKHKSGDWIWVMDRGKVMSWTPDGKPEWMFGSHIEITSMKNLQESLEQERRKFTTIFNSSYRFVGFLELDGTLIEANETAMNFAGLKTQDVIGKKFWDCHWWQISAQTQAHLKEAIERAAKGETVNYEVAVWDVDKKPVTILFNLKPVRNHHGEVVYIIPEGTIIQELIDYRSKLETKNQELEGFAAVAAHDLREPLRMIRQFMDRLSTKYGDQLDDTAKKYIHFALDDSKRMGNLIDELLAYAEIGGFEEAAPEWVDLNEVFDETLQLEASVLSESDAKVTRAELPKVWANKTAMSLLFQNLIGNGLKYQAPGNQPYIEVNSSENEVGYTLSFRDNGIGIAPENHAKVFNLFTRLHRKAEYAGTGMGLAACKKIISVYKGTIWVDSDLGKGADFRVFIPKSAQIER